MCEVLGWRFGLGREGARVCGLCLGGEGEGGGFYRGVVVGLGWKEGVGVLRWVRWGRNFR